jgi:hypothetical protein
MNEKTWCCRRCWLAIEGDEPHGYNKKGKCDECGKDDVKIWPTFDYDGPDELPDGTLTQRMEGRLG